VSGASAARSEAKASEVGAPASEAQSSEPSGARGDGSRDHRIALRLGVLVAVMLALFHRGHFMSTDELGVFFQTKSLSENFSLAVPTRVHMAFRGHDARSYSQYVVGQSLLAVPFYAAGDLVDPLLTPHMRRALAGPVGMQSFAGEPPVGSSAFAVLFYPPAVVGALAGLFFLFERRLGASRASALAAALALAFCTHLALMGTLFLQHGTETLLALAAFFFWHRFRESGAARDLLLGAACAAFIFNVRAAGALNGLALGGYLAFVLAERFWRVRDGARLAREIVLAAAPLAASAAFYVAMNRLKWGALLESPQMLERSTLGGDPRRALFGFLASPGMSVFLYTPLLLLAPLSLARLWRTQRAEVVTVLALAATTLALYSTYELWTGLYSCPGPRYLVTPMVFSLLGLGPWLDHARGVLARAAFGVLAAAGASVQLVSAVVSWSRLASGYNASQPPFGFVFDWENAPLMQGIANSFNPQFWDIWIVRTALGWPGFPGRPLLAAAVFACWALALAASVVRLRRALGQARAAAGS
jgi:hypothetical protein